MVFKTIFNEQHFLLEKIFFRFLMYIILQSLIFFLVTKVYKVKCDKTIRSINCKILYAITNQS